MSRYRPLVLICLIATSMFMTPRSMASANASWNHQCDEERQSALESILDDEAILGDLDDESRGSIIAWASASLDTYGTRCASRITMRAYGLRVKEGIRVIREMAHSGTTHRAGWLYRARLITWHQLHALKKMTLIANENDSNARMIMTTMIALTPSS